MPAPLVLLALGAGALLLMSKKAAPASSAQPPPASMVTAVNGQTVPATVKVGTVLVVASPLRANAFGVQNPAPAGSLASPLQAAPDETPGGVGFVASAPGTVTLIATWTDPASGQAMNGQIAVTVTA